MVFKVELVITYKPGVLNPEEGVIERALRNQGYDFGKLRKGRYVSYETDVATEEDARRQAKEISDKFLANFNLETHHIASITNVDSN